MNVEGWLLWGFCATVAMTTISIIAQGLGITRMNMPLLLGAVFTGGRGRATWAGTLAHMAVGWLFALVYVGIFESVGAGLWRGAVLGGLHALVVLTMGMALLPSFHRGMASELHGPTASRLLEPPGLLALHYGPATPLTIVVSHVVYGMILGYFYVPR